jgi:hypothetical protein
MGVITSGIDFVDEGMQRLGLSTKTTKQYVDDYVDSLIIAGESYESAAAKGKDYEQFIVNVIGNTNKATVATSDYQAEVSRTVLPDGMVKIVDSLGNTVIQFDYAKKTAAGYFDTIKDAAGNVLDHVWIPSQTKATEALKGSAEEMLKAQKAADEYALKLLEAGNKVKIAGIDTWGKINVAQIEADTARIVAAFKSIDNTISVTGKTISDLWGTYTKIDGFDQSKILDSIREQERIQREAAEKQNGLLDAQIALTKARAEQIRSGDAVIKVEATGLKAHLELIFGEILKETQIKASEQGLQFLLGFS